MLVIRFFRTGKKHQPFFKIVVTDKKNPPRGGCFVDEVGFWNPITKEKNLKAEKIKHWLSKGAKPSDSAYNLFIREKILEGKKVDVHKKSKKKKEETEGTEVKGVKAETASAETGEAEEAKAEKVKTAAAAEPEKAEEPAKKIEEKIAEKAEEETKEKVKTEEEPKKEEAKAEVEKETEEDAKEEKKEEGLT